MFPPLVSKARRRWSPVLPPAWRATTELFARHGARPVLFGLGGEALDDAAAASGGVVVHGYVTKTDDIAAAKAACGDRIGIVFNAAGLITIDKPATVSDEPGRRRSRSMSPAR
jgi:NAD(P)-dependent dehydrogenase (short-subunit alcohol dehydrogenase family)